MDVGIEHVARPLVGNWPSGTRLQGRGLGGSSGTYFALVKSNYAVVDLLCHLDMTFFNAFFAKQQIAFVKFSQTLCSSFTGINVGRQSQDLPDHHRIEACSGNPGLLPELSL